METLIIQLTNSKAYKLIHELEELHLIRVLKTNVKPETKLSDKYIGKLPAEVADELQEYVTKSRNEWKNNI